MHGLILCVCTVRIIFVHVAAITVLSQSSKLLRTDDVFLLQYLSVVIGPVWDVTRISINRDSFQP